MDEQFERVEDPLSQGCAAIAVWGGLASVVGGVVSILVAVPIVLISALVF